MAMTTLVFGAVGPAIGAVVIWLQRPPGSFQKVVLLSYVFGGVPTLVAGVAYGRLRSRESGPPSRWHTRALLGATAGLFGCFMFFLFVSVYDLLTVSDATLRDLDFRFLRRLIVAGVPAGTICALLIGAPRSRPMARANQRV